MSSQCEADSTLAQAARRGRPESFHWSSHSHERYDTDGLFPQIGV